MRQRMTRWPVPRTIADGGRTSYRILGLMLLSCALLFNWTAVRGADTVANRLDNTVITGLHDGFTAYSKWPGEAGESGATAVWLTVNRTVPGAGKEADATPEGEPFVTLQWVHHTAGFFPTKLLQLIVQHGDDTVDAVAGGRSQVIDLLQVSAHDSGQYTAFVSLHKDTSLLQAAVFEGESGASWETVTAKNDRYDSAPVLYMGQSVPVAAYSGTLTGYSRDDHLAIAVGDPGLGAVVVPAFRPVAQRIEIGELSGQRSLIPVTILDHDAVPGLRIRGHSALPGRYDVSVMAAHRDVGRAEKASKAADVRRHITSVTVNEDDVTISLPVDSLPLGAATVHVDYVQNGDVLLTKSLPVTVGKAEVGIQITDVRAAEGAVHGKVSMRPTAPLPDVKLRLTGELTRLDWNEATRSYDEVAGFDELTLLSVAFDDLRASGSLPFTVAVPENSGLWRLSVHAERQPQIQLYVSGTEETWSMDTGADDVYVAVTDQGSRKILVLDPDIADWDLSAAVKWSWAPGLFNGFMGLTKGWGNPSGVKLRESELWGGQWMVVVDSKGLAAIVPYPAGNTRKWGLVISGNLHSAELLPDGNIAIAASTGGFVRVYTSSQGRDSDTYTEYPQVGAHGVLWDPEGEVLWALGTHELAALKVGGTPAAPTLTPVHKVALPSSGGHDLAPVYGNTDRLWITTTSRVYQYEKSTDTWITSFPGAEATALSNIKGVGNLPNGRIVYSRQKAGTLHSWTTDTVDFVLPNDSRTRTNAAFYKARVWHPAYQ